MAHLGGFILLLDAEGPGAEATPVSWARPQSAVAIGLRGGLRSLHCVRRCAAELVPMSSTTRPLASLDRGELCIRYRVRRQAHPNPASRPSN